MRSRLPRGDAGLTLAEVTVSMTIMAVFLALSTSGLLQLYRVANATVSASDAQVALNTAFLRLDKEIRYSSGISTPAKVGGDTYVEYLTTSTGNAICTELRVRATSGLLQRRTWTNGTVPLVPGAWTTLATGLSPSSTFTVTLPDGSFNFQRLQIDVFAASGSVLNPSSRHLDVTFTLLNTSLSTNSTTICTAARAIP